MRNDRSWGRARRFAALVAASAAVHAGCGNDIPVFPGPAESGSSGTVIASPAQAVSGGDSFSCSLTEDRQFSCWGNDFYLQASPEQAPIFSILPDDGPFENIVTGGQHGCMRNRSFILIGNPPKPDQQIDFAGGPACWGNNNFNQIDHPNREYRKMAAGSYHSCGTKFSEGSGSDKRPDCWGRNDFGQSAAPNERFAVKVQSEADTFVQAGFTLYVPGRFELDEGRNTLALGGLHSCGLLDWETKARPTSPGKGSILCWGDNSYNQSALIGDTPKIDSIEPPGYIDGDTGPRFISVTAGHAHSCGIYDLTPDTPPYQGPIFCWGQNYPSGGPPSPTDLVPPTGDFRVIEAAIGAREGDLPNTFTCAIDSLGSIQCWGLRPNGSPPEPPAGTGYFALGVGWDTICAVQRPLFVYEFQSGGQVLGTLTLDIESVDGPWPAWSGTDWMLSDAADIVSIELDDAVFGLGSGNILDLATMGIFQGAGSPPIGATVAANGDQLLSSGRIQDEPVTPGGDSPYFRLIFSSSGGQDEVTSYRDPNVPLGPPGTVNLPGLTVNGDWVREDLGGTTVCTGRDAEGQASPPT